MKIEKPGILFLSILTCLAAGFIGSFFTLNSVNTWYLTLNKPVFTPPSWLFGPAWTTLFILMGIALYRIWIRVEKPLQNIYIRIFAIHLAINAFWSIAFFGLRDPGLGLIVIILLWLMILYLIKAFYKIDKIAGLLLVPYIAWVTFASLLNYSIWKLN